MTSNDYLRDILRDFEPRYNRLLNTRSAAAANASTSAALDWFSSWKETGHADFDAALALLTLILTDRIQRTLSEHKREERKSEIPAGPGWYQDAGYFLERLERCVETLELLRDLSLLDDADGVFVAAQQEIDGVTGALYLTGDSHERVHSHKRAAAMYRRADAVHERFDALYVD